MKPNQNIIAHFHKKWMFAFVTISLAFGQTLYSQTQQTNDTTAISLSSPSAAVTQQPQVRGQEQSKKRHTIGFGISTTDGDATTGQQSMMLSALYAYSLSPTLDIETSLQQMSMSKWRKEFGDFFVVSSALSHDINFVIKPFEFLPTFRVGIGSSARWQKSLISSMVTTVDSVSTTTFPRTTGQNTFAVGATLKLEYLITFVPTLDISIRAQGHIYAPPIIGENNHAPGGSPGGAASLGIFFLLHP
jgi:hypothetical protein